MEGRGHSVDYRSVGGILGWIVGTGCSEWLAVEVAEVGKAREWHHSLGEIDQVFRPGKVAESIPKEGTELEIVTDQQVTCFGRQDWRFADTAH